MRKQNRNTAPATQVRINSVGWMLKRLGTQLDNNMTRELKQIGLNISQFSILMMLMENEGSTQVEMGKIISMPAYATTRTLDKLEAGQYVERRIDESSRRSFRIFLTSKGRKLGPVLFAIVDRVNAGLLSDLSESGQTNLKGVLQKLVSAKPG